MFTMNNSMRDLKSLPCDTAILPVGALEQHGSHLPLGTDTIIASALAERMAKQLDAYLLPPVAITSSIEHREGKGTVYLKASTLALVIRDIAESLCDSGFKRLVIVNGHGGNWILKPTVRQIDRDLKDKNAGMDVVLIHTSVAFARLHEYMEHDLRHDVHGGEYETSLMLHLHKELVGEIVPQQNPTTVPQDYMDYFDVTELTEDGYWGFPEAGTAEKGEAMLQLTVDCAMVYLRDFDEAKKRIRGRED